MRDKTFRQSLKEFVTTARKSRSLHQNYFHTNDLTKATPKSTGFAWRWLRLLMRFNLSILLRKIMQGINQEYLLGRMCSQGLVFRCEDCGCWVDLWLTFMLKLPSWFKSTVNKTRGFRRRALLLSLIVVAGKCKFDAICWNGWQPLLLESVAIFRINEGSKVYVSLVSVLCEWRTGKSYEVWLF